MTRVVTTTSDTITLTAAEYAKAVDMFVRSCHQDLYQNGESFAVVTPAPVAHFEVRVALSGVVPGGLDPGVTIDAYGTELKEGDIVLIYGGGVDENGLWQVFGVGEAARPTNANTAAELVAKPYVRVQNAEFAGQWFLLTDLLLADITLADYAVVP